jgi:hypothetical protein
MTEHWELLDAIAAGYTICIDDPSHTYANNAPRYDFKCVRCGFCCESHTNESQIWSCPLCAANELLADGERLTPLRKVIKSSPSIPRVWHGHHSDTTGQWVTDRKQQTEQLHVASEEATQRLGMEHRFIEVDMSDHKHLGITEEGLDTTHDAHVKLGWKQSKGQFVFPMSGGSS